jgi:flagellar hook-length control protein FliK
MGADIGVEIAKAAKGEREDLLIRLDPRDLGRINVRLSFDGDGVLRAVMSADSPAALDMLRRESGDLNRALADAGIRSDAQSLRFDARSGDQGQGGSHSGQRGQQAQSGGSQGSTGDGSADLADVHYRPLRSSGQVDLMA